MSIELFNKHPYIKKILSKYIENGESVSDFKLRHLSFLMATYKQDIKIIKPAYNQFTTFQEFYDAILRIAKDNKGNRFSDCFSKEDLITYCEEQDLSYKELNDSSISVEINNFEQMQTLGSKRWCITRNFKDFNKYSNIGKQSIIFNFDKRNTINYRFGKTIGKQTLIFNDYNQNVTPHHIRPSNSRLSIESQSERPWFESFLRRNKFISPNFMILELISFIFLISFAILLLNLATKDSTFYYIVGHSLMFIYVLFYVLLFRKIAFCGFISYFSSKQLINPEYTGDYTLFISLYTVLGGGIVSFPLIFAILSTQG